MNEDEDQTSKAGRQSSFPSSSETSREHQESPIRFYEVIKYLIFCYKVHELKMSVSKMDIFEKLIEGYVKVPPSFQEQVITSLAIHLFQNVELKKRIIYESEPLQYTYISRLKWEKLIEKWPTNICQKLPLPPVLKNKLIPRLRIIARQVYIWNRQQQDIFNISPLYVNSCLNPSDWIVVEMRLDEKKIAKRLAQDERIPVFQRYRMACFHCLEDIIPSLWNQIPLERRCNDWLLHEELESVQIWNLHLDGFYEKVSPGEEEFWDDLLLAGVWDGSRSTVIQSWGKSDIRVRREILKDTAMRAMKQSILRHRDSDIFCFLLTQMTKEQRVELFQEIFQNYEIYVLVFLLPWPYLDLLVPIIKELWNILPEAKYKKLLLTLINIYCNKYRYDVGRKNYPDCKIGYLIIELLDETPDHFKRYVFGNKYQEDTNLFVVVKILYNILNMAHHNNHYLEVFKHIWKHVTAEEKIFFLRSHYGKIFCCNLAKEDKSELFTSILRECLPEGKISKFNNAVLDRN